MLAGDVVHASISGPVLGSRSHTLRELALADQADTGIDFTPLGTSMGIILITFTLSYLRRADIMQVAQGAIMETMSDIVLVMDHDNHIIGDSRDVGGQFLERDSRVGNRHAVD